MECPMCKRKVPKDTEVCPYCGAEIAKYQTPAKGESDDAEGQESESSGAPNDRAAVP